MQDYADSRAVIVEKRAHDDSVLVSWDHDRWARDYKVVIHPADNKSAKFADVVSGADSYRFINLQPDTEYVVSVGERGDDSTQASVSVRTLQAGAHPFDPSLHLSAWQDGNDVAIIWSDHNGEATGTASSAPSTAARSTRLKTSPVPTTNLPTLSIQAGPASRYRTGYSSGWASKNCTLTQPRSQSADRSPPEHERALRMARTDAASFTVR